jgi:hypothetical protein
MAAIALAFPLPVPKTTHHYQICAWCQRILGELAHTSEYDSYGICPECATTYFTNLYNEVPHHEHKPSEPSTSQALLEPELLAFERAA